MWLLNNFIKIEQTTQYFTWYKEFSFLDLNFKHHNKWYKSNVNEYTNKGA